MLNNVGKRQYKYMKKNSFRENFMGEIEKKLGFGKWIRRAKGDKSLK